MRRQRCETGLVNGVFSLKRSTFNAVIEAFQSRRTVGAFVKNIVKHLGGLVERTTSEYKLKSRFAPNEMDACKRV